MRGLISSFTSARMMREGSVGLLLLVGLGAFGTILLWLNRITPGETSYRAIIEFANAGGMQKGSVVRFRGVKVGTITKVQPGTNAIDVEIQINSPDLIIPSNSLIEANQSGLISENIIEITPKGYLPGKLSAKPLDKDCNSSLIICNGSRLRGTIGISVDELMRQSTIFAAQYSNEKFYKNVNRTLETSANAAANIADLSKDLQDLSKTFKGQISVFSGTASTLQRSTAQLTTTATKTADQLGTTAKDFSITAKQANRLLTNLDNLITTNRSSLVGTLNSMTETSNQLRQTVTSLSPAINRLTQGQLLTNLETLSANAAEASVNLKDASKTLNDPKNIVLLQQTLDAARATFENTQKITADLDELTGDPKFRQNMLRLVNGLSKLVSSGKDIQEKTKVAVTLDGLKADANQSKVVITASVPQKQILVINSQPKIVEKVETTPAPVPEPPNLSQEQLLQQLREYREKGIGNREQEK
ncbi:MULTISPECIES: MlaD family protein [Aphanizomenonaceae]|uniref:MlaD family protein n=1 Tax=Dolichospermum heterosporum TAC447 TaxID=747523 RepID=A0ABY5LR03_9CYAN|nr:MULTISPECIES: MlaD family protein [Aphanizomenonaceae]MBE9259595.1 MCE family protein [Dolichospermum sp. LEGE 00246]UUO14396.1 MlaD family protein [Dolichospermum heterosporum TAC447]